MTVIFITWANAQRERDKASGGQLKSIFDAITWTTTTTIEATLITLVGFSALPNMLAFKYVSVGCHSRPNVP